MAPSPDRPGLWRHRRHHLEAEARCFRSVKVVDLDPGYTCFYVLIVQPVYVDFYEGFSSSGKR